MVSQILPNCKHTLFCLCGLVTLTLAALFPHSPAHANENKPLFFGIVPQQSATRMAEIWLPVINEMKAKTGLDIRFTTTKDIPTFEACLARGAYSLAYMNPYHYTTFHDLAGYQAFARQKDRNLKGILVARKDSGLASLKDLDGKQVAFPSPAAFGASVLPQAEAKREGLEIDPIYVKSHDSVYRAVALGLFPAGGGVERTFNSFPEEVRASLTIIYTTGAYTPHAFAAHKDLPPETVAALQSAMLAITDPALLSPLGMKGFEAGGNADWDDVRALNLPISQIETIADEDGQCHSG